MLRLKKRARYKHGCIKTPDFYRPRRSCGQGNVFTSVCLSTGGVSRTRHPPRPDTPTPLGPGRPPPGPATPLPPGTRQTPPGTRHITPPPRTRQNPPPPTRQPPPPEQTPADGLRAAGTHPTGMHSRRGYFIDFKK